MHGYDIFAIEDVEIPSSVVTYVNVLGVYENNDVLVNFDSPTLIRTGIKAKMEDDEVLLLFNRSSNPIKKGLVLANGVGVIDAKTV